MQGNDCTVVKSSSDFSNNNKVSVTVKFGPLPTNQDDPVNVFSAAKQDSH